MRLRALTPLLAVALLAAGCACHSSWFKSCPEDPERWMRQAGCWFAADGSIQCPEVPKVKP